MTDEFAMGQWMRGRIYERRSDLSPDGKYVIYFAMNGKWDSETRGAWTCISRVPYLKGVTVLPKGDCWHGGGLFTGNKTYWLNDGCGHSVLVDSTELTRHPGYTPPHSYGGECPGVYYLRLLRDGWSWGERSRKAVWEDMDVFEKGLPDGWILRKFAHTEIGAPPGKGCYWDEHDLEHAESETRIRCRSWEWAELVDGRLVWASDGQLRAARLGPSGIYDEKLLHDFNDMKFEAIAAPY